MNEYNFKRLQSMIAEEASKSGYKKISDLSGVATTTIWRIIAKNQDTTVRTAEKIMNAIHELKTNRGE